MPSPRTDTPPLNTSAKLIDVQGNPTAYFKRFLDVLWTRTGGFHDLSATVADLPGASAPQTFLRISNDLGATWSPVSTTGSLTATFYNTEDTVIATQAITGTCSNVTGYWTLTAGAATLLPTTITYSTGNGTSQIVSATVALGGRQTTLTFISSIDSTALGGYTGGGPGK